MCHKKSVDFHWYRSTWPKCSDKQFANIWIVMNSDSRIEITPVWVLWFNVIYFSYIVMGQSPRLQIWPAAGHLRYGQLWFFSMPSVPRHVSGSPKTSLTSLLSEVHWFANSKTRTSDLTITSPACYQLRHSGIRDWNASMNNSQNQDVPMDSHNHVDSVFIISLTGSAIDKYVISIICTQLITQCCCSALFLLPPCDGLSPLFTVRHTSHAPGTTVAHKMGINDVCILWR